MKKIFYLFVFLLTQSKIFAQYPTLLKDINTVGNSVPNSYCNVNNIVYFAHDDNVHGTELWRTDGTAVGTYLVKDINLGFDGSYCNQMIALNGTLFFTAFTQNEGMELWKSDGTEAGTVLVKDIIVGGVSSSITLLTNVGSYVAFAAKESITTGQEFWISDGTAAGTIKQTNMAASSPNNRIGEITVGGNFFNTYIFFTVGGNITLSNNGVWKTNYSCFLGCSALTTPNVISGNTGASDLLFTINSVSTNWELFFRNSTKGLSKYNINTTILTPLNTFTSYPPDYDTRLVAYNNAIYFTGNDATNGWELWKSDGTVAGTALLKNINNNPANGNSNPSSFQVFNNELYFSANDGIVGTELWKTNGTNAGTVLVSDIITGTDSSYPTNLSVNGTKLYFETFPTDINYSKYQMRVLDASNSQYLKTSLLYQMMKFILIGYSSIIPSFLLVLTLCMAMKFGNRTVRLQEQASSKIFRRAVPLLRVFCQLGQILFLQLPKDLMVIIL
jgi:trimeric autotransporter adhesin